MKKIAIKTLNAPEPIGPFSQAIAAGNIIFVSAQFGRDPVTKEFKMESIETETKRVMNNIQNILKEAGVDFVNQLSLAIYDYRCRERSYDRAAVSLHPIVRAEESLSALFSSMGSLTNRFYRLTGL